MEIEISKHAWYRYRQIFPKAPTGEIYRRICKQVKKARVVPCKCIKDLGFWVFCKSYFALYRNRLYVLKWKPKEQQLIVMTVWGKLQQLEIEYLNERSSCSVIKKFGSNS